MFWLGLAIFRQILTQTNVYKHKRTLLLKYSTYEHQTSQQARNNLNIQIWILWW